MAPKTNRSKNASTQKSFPVVPSTEARWGERPRLEPTALMIAAVAALTLGVYIRVAWFPFVNFDDPTYVFGNSHVTSGLNWGTVKWALTSFAVSNWHPITWVSHALDWQIFGTHAGGHHVTSLLLHIANALLLYWLLRRATGAMWQSLVATALFAVHPLNVEAVAWVAERKTLLCTFFFLLALAAYGWYSRRPGLGRYLVVAGLFVLALASKPMVITFPFVLLLLDFWPLGRVKGWTLPSAKLQVPQVGLSRLAVEKLPLLLFCIASAVITILAQRSGGSVQSLTGWPLDWRIQNAIHSYALYLCKFVLPRNLAPFYPAELLHGWQVGWAVLLLLTTGLVIWKFHAKRCYLVIGGLWFVGMMIPVIGLVQVGSQAMADRYAYIPMMGICVAVVWGLTDVANALSVDARWRSAAVAIVLCTMAALTWRQTGYWRSSLDLFTRDLQVTRSNSLAEVLLGMSLVDAGREDEAYVRFQKALTSDPHDRLALLYSGIYLARHGHYPESIESLQSSIQTGHLSAPETVLASRSLGIVYSQLGDRELARAHFTLAVLTDPNDLADVQRLDQLDKQDAMEKAEKLSAASQQRRLANQ